MSTASKHAHNAFLYSIPKYVTYSQISLAYSSFLATLSIVYEPATFKEVSSCKEWIAAMQDEVTVFEQNATWTIVDLMLGKKAIGSKWVSKVNLQANGQVERYKAKFVAKGYSQQEDLDYNETFYLWLRCSPLGPPLVWQFLTIGLPTKWMFIMFFCKVTLLKMFIW